MGHDQDAEIVVRPGLGGGGGSRGEEQEGGEESADQPVHRPLP